MFFLSFSFVSVSCLTCIYVSMTEERNKNVDCKKSNLSK